MTEVLETPLSGRHFVLRRVHSLLGLVPIGVFLTEHLVTNGAILLGAEHYQRDVDFITSVPGLLFLEIFGIWVPLGLHAALGFAYTFTGRPNTRAYPYAANWRYTWMRITGMIALVYIFFHLASTRWGWTFGFLTQSEFDKERATATTVGALTDTVWMPYFYGVGVLACVYHFANGLWTAAITWGLTVSVSAPRWGYACLGLGLGLALLGVAAIVRFATYDLPVETAAAGLGLNLGN